MVRSSYVLDSHLRRHVCLGIMGDHFNELLLDAEITFVLHSSPEDIITITYASVFLCLSVILFLKLYTFWCS